MQGLFALVAQQRRARSILDTAASARQATTALLELLMTFLALFPDLTLTKLRASASYALPGLSA